MPIYEYECNQCGNRFEKLRSMKEADVPIQCIKCQSPDSHRLLSRVFAQSDGKSIAGSSCGCGNCSGGSCGSCNN